MNQKIINTQITIECEDIYSQNNAGTTNRIVMLNGIKIFELSTPTQDYHGQQYPLRQFEKWIISLGSSHNFNCRRNRRTNSRYFMSFFQKIWRKFFTK